MCYRCNLLIRVRWSKWTVEKFVHHSVINNCLLKYQDDTILRTVIFKDTIIDFMYMYSYNTALFLCSISSYYCNTIKIFFTLLYKFSASSMPCSLYCSNIFRWINTISDLSDISNSSPIWVLNLRLNSFDISEHIKFHQNLY